MTEKAAHLMEARKQGEKVTMDKIHPTKKICPRSPSSFNLVPLPDSLSTGLQICFSGRELAQHPGGCVLDPQ